MGLVLAISSAVCLQTPLICIGSFWIKVYQQQFKNQSHVYGLVLGSKGIPWIWKLADIYKASPTWHTFITPVIGSEKHTSLKGIKLWYCPMQAFLS